MQVKLKITKESYGVGTMPDPLSVYYVTFAEAFEDSNRNISA